MDYATADSGFRLKPPVVGNPYHTDAVFQTNLHHYVDEAVVRSIAPDLERFGHLCVTKIAAYGDDAEGHPPTLTQYTPWCERVDHIHTSHGWKALRALSAEEGLVAIAYEPASRRLYGPQARLYQFLKLYLFIPDSAVFQCPLSMTDGAARVCELLGDDRLKTDVLPRLISRNPDVFWMSGQWMTERPGGSDISATETKAVPEQGDAWRVHGFKWFSSATDADMTMLLARTQDEHEQWRPHSSGLSLFWAPMRTADGTLNGVHVHRLKQKYGTKAVPTAELELRGMRAHLVGAIARGVPNIATILNITRIHSAVAGAASMGRGVAMAKAYAHARQVHGKPLIDHALHARHLADLEVVHAASTALAFYAVSLLGRTEVPPAAATATAIEHDVLMLRLTTPLAKLWISKKAVAALSECMEALGGQGYMEDVGLARHLRDMQVNTIWEGTTNVLALDVWRVFQKDARVEAALVATVQQLVQEAQGPLAAHAAHCTGALSAVLGFVRTQPSADAVVYHARGIAFALAQTLAGALLLHQASRSPDPRLARVAMAFCSSRQALLDGFAPGRDAADDRVLLARL